MGAGRGDLMALPLTEAMLLALGGGAAGILLGSATLRFLVAQLADEDMPAYYLTAQLDWPVLLFSLGISVAAGFLFGLYPAWEAARTSLAGTLREESGQASSTRGTARVRKLLVCAQVMISAVLLIPTGLLLKSLVNLMHVDLGMQTEHVIGFGISPERNGYTQAQSRALFERVESELAAIPGVRGVGASLLPLVAGSNWKTDVTVEGAAPDPHADNRASIDEVGPGFFGTLGIPLIAGREFTERDNATAPKVAIVNQQFASHLLAGRSALGRKFGFSDAKKPDIEIVGVVKDSHYAGVKQEPPRLFYMPWRQDKDFGLGSLNFYVRSALPCGPDDPADPPRAGVARSGSAGGEPAPAGRYHPAEHPLRPDGPRAGRGVRHSGDGAGHARALWRDGPQRHAAHAGDRHPHGAGRGAG